MNQDCYGNVKEEIPKDIPKPLGKRVITTTFLDANLLHCNRKISHSCIALCQHYPNRLVLKETSHCGDHNIWFSAVLVAAKTATEQIMDLRNTLRYLVPIMTKAYMFGDNKSVVMSSTIPQSILNK